LFTFSLSALRVVSPTLWVLLPYTVCGLSISVSVAVFAYAYLLVHAFRLTLPSTHAPPLLFFSFRNYMNSYWFGTNYCDSRYRYFYSAYSDGYCFELFDTTTGDPLGTSKKFSCSDSGTYCISAPLYSTVFCLHLLSRHVSCPILLLSFFPSFHSPKLASFVYLPFTYTLTLSLSLALPPPPTPLPQETPLPPTTPRQPAAARPLLTRTPPTSATAPLTRPGTTTTCSTSEMTWCLRPSPPPHFPPCPRPHCPTPTPARTQ
jgi:hypothetical protein